MSPRRPSCPASGDAALRGFSLVELMVSITIGLLILAGLTSLFVSQSKSRDELDKSNRMIDNGRYALELLSADLQLAGFYGELDPSTLALPGSISNPCSVDPAVMSDMLRLHVHGYNAATPSSTIGSPPCGLGSLKAGSDILVLRRADTADPAIAQVAAVNGTHYLQVTRCRLDTANQFVLDTNPANFTLRQRDCTEGSTTPYADLRRFRAHVYFVSPDNVSGDGVPTLMRRELDPNGSGAFVTTPLVEGIEYFQVEYGIDDPAADTNADGVAGLDGIADSYVSCSACTIQDWSNVVSVKLHLVARNIERTANYSDPKTYSLGLAGNYTPTGNELKYKRHAYTELVRLKNPAGRRE